MSPFKERIEYRLRWTYPFLKNSGRSEYGPPQESYEKAWKGWGIHDDGWIFAGEPIEVEARTVRESEWQTVRSPNA